MSRLLLLAASTVCSFVAVKAATKIVDSYLENRPYAGLKVVYTAKPDHVKPDLAAKAVDAMIDAYQRDKETERAAAQENHEAEKDVKTA